MSVHEHVINVWNYLPYNIVCFNSLNAFKQSIERVDFNLFLQCYLHSSFAHGHYCF